MSYKVLKQDDHSFTVQHPDGSHFRVAKKGLSKPVLDRIQKFASGGIVQDEPISLELDPTKVMASPPQSDPNAFEATPEMLQQEESQKAPYVMPSEMPAKPMDKVAAPVRSPSSEASPASPPEPPQPQPHGALPVNPITAEAYKNRLEGTAAEGAALGKQGDALGKVYQDAQAQQQRQLETYNTAKADILKEREALTKQIASTNIDSGRFWRQLPTGNKILAALSIMVSGIGGASNNMAAEALKDRIKDDINDQLANLNTKKGLLAENFNKTKDLNQAMAATTDQMLTALKFKTEEIAAKTQNPLMKAKAQQAIGVIQGELSHLAEQRALMSVQGDIASGGVPVGSPAYKMALTNKEMAEKMVPVNGQAYFAYSPKEAEGLRSVQSLEPVVRDILNRINQIGPSAAVPNTDENRRAKALMSQVIPKLNELADLKRLSEEDIKVLKASITDPTTLKNIVSNNVENTEFMKTLNSTLENKFKAALPGYRGSVRTLASPGFKR